MTCPDTDADQPAPQISCNHGQVIQILNLIARFLEESRNRMSITPDVAGLAALAICESLLLALNDRKILPEREILGVLKDAAASHSNAPDGDKSKMHKDVAALINAIIDGGNSVRRPVHS